MVLLSNSKGPQRVMRFASLLVVLASIFAIWKAFRNYNSHKLTGHTHLYENFDDLMPVDASAYINVYSAVGTKGNSATVRNSVSNLGVVGWNEAILSFELGPYTKATFYEHANYSGKHATYQNTQDVVLGVPQFAEQELGKRVSSVKLEIIEPYVIVYSQQNLGGNSKIYRGHVPTLDETWNKSVVALRLSSFTKVTLYSGQGFDKNSKVKEFTNTSSATRDIRYVGNDLRDSIQSFKVEQTYKTG